MGDMAGALDHVLQQPALDRIIVDDKNMGRHWNLLAFRRASCTPKGTEHQRTLAERVEHAVLRKACILTNADASKTTDPTTWKRE
jgi:hypothetical protein